MAREPKPETVVENKTPGTTLHLGDGRRLVFGERATVTPELAALLRGQAK